MLRAQCVDYCSAEFALAIKSYYPWLCKPG